MKVIELLESGASKLQDDLRSALIRVLNTSVRMIVHGAEKLDVIISVREATHKDDILLMQTLYHNLIIKLVKRLGYTCEVDDLGLMPDRDHMMPISTWVATHDIIEQDMELVFLVAEIEHEGE